MNKILKISSISLVLGYTVFCGGFSFSAETDGPVDAVEEAIHAMVDPFLARIPEEPKPKETPVEEIQPVAQTSQPAPNLEDVPKEETVLPPPKPVLPNLMLTGTVSKTTKPQAIVNGKVLNVGDTIEGATLMAVSKGEASVLFDGETFLLRLNRKDSQNTN